MKGTAQSGTVSFRHLAADIPLWVGFGLFVLYGSYLGLRDPGVFTSLKGILLVLLIVSGNLLVWWVVWKRLRTNWHFTLTPTHLIATLWSRRERIEIPWEMITRVTKLPRMERGGLSYSQIETAQGRKVPVGTHLIGYQQFLEEIRKRAVNCQTFDPYLTEWDR